MTYLLEILYRAPADERREGRVAACCMREDGEHVEGPSSYGE